MMNKSELSDDAATAQSDDPVLTLRRAELLLAAAEAAEARAVGDEREAVWREAIGRMLRSAATLRAEAAAGTAARLAVAEAERERVAAEAEALRAEVKALRAEIEALSAERDLCLALTIDAGGAIARHLARWREMHGADPASDAPAFAGGAERGKDPALLLPGDLAGTRIGPGASNPVARLVLAIAELPGIVPLLDLEGALTQLPSVRSGRVASLHGGFATVELDLRPPTATLVVAGEILGLPGSALAVDEVADGRIAARYCQ